MSKRMCWRHWFWLTFHAYGCLLDLTGREYPRRAQIILTDAHRCDRCRRLSNA